MYACMCLYVVCASVPVKDGRQRTDLLLQCRHVKSRTYSTNMQRKKEKGVKRRNIFLFRIPCMPKIRHSATQEMALLYFSVEEKEGKNLESHIGGHKN